MEVKRQHITLVLVITALMIASLYFFWLRSLVQQAYDGNAPVWFMSLTEHMYPRFEVEKQRFELTFFQHKADQVIIRLAFVLFLAGMAVRAVNAEHFIAQNSRTVTKVKLDQLRQIFYLGLLFFTWDWYQDFPGLVKMEPFYKGVHLFRLLQINIPPLEVLYALFAVYILSIMLVLCNYRKVIFALFTAVILVFLQGYLFSFEKIGHGHATLTYACLLMPWLLFEIGLHEGEGQKQSFILFLIQCTIAGAYFLSGAEKLLNNGLKWTSTDTLSTYLKMHSQEAGKWLIEQPLLLSVLPWLVLIFQLFSITVLFYPRFRYPFIVAGIAFHWSTTWLMGIGAYLSPWIFVYVFFLDLGKLKLRSLGNVRSTSNSQNGS